MKEVPDYENLNDTDHSMYEYNREYERMLVNAWVATISEKEMERK